MSGSFSSYDSLVVSLDGPYYAFNTTGTVILPHNRRSDDADLWDRMYVRPKPVIIVCGFCKSHNAVSNPTCIQCGAPMGLGVERQYG